MAKTILYNKSNGIRNNNGSNCRYELSSVAPPINYHYSQKKIVTSTRPRARAITDEKSSSSDGLIIIYDENQKILICGARTRTRQYSGVGSRRVIRLPPLFSVRIWETDGPCRRRRRRSTHIILYLRKNSVTTFRRDYDRTV